MKRIAIIGTGYVGLVTGCCLAEMGNQVTCLDIDKEKIDSLRMGGLPFYEPLLRELFDRVTGSHRLFFTNDYLKALAGAELCFLALPTPPGVGDACDTSILLQAARELASLMEAPLIIVIKSTVPMGTSQLVKEVISRELERRKIFIPFDVINNPEFLREGSAVSDCMRPDRIILGGENPVAIAIVRDLYLPLLSDPNKVLVMDSLSAELSKYAANAMLACRLSFMNYLSVLCETAGSDIEMVKRSLGFDERIGPHYLNAGIGFGGSCLPKDLLALRASASEYGLPTHLLDTILQINEEMKERFFDKIQEHFSDLSGKRFALWGLSFKPETDDLRKAPSLYLIQRLLEMGASVQAYDPVAMPKAKILMRNYEGLTFCEDEYEATDGADAILLVTEWKTFRLADFVRIKSMMRSAVIFDGRNIYNGLELRHWGFDYYPVGKPALRTETAR